MSDRDDYTIEGARSACERNELRDWVARFLASPGSDNAPLGEKLSRELRWWIGPIELPIDQLHRLAGPTGDPVVCAVDEDFWDERVDVMETRVEEGADLAPVIVAYRRDHLELEDGNHRVESVREAGGDMVWAVVGFEHQQDRDRVVEQRVAETDRTGREPRSRDATR